MRIRFKFAFAALLIQAGCQSNAIHSAAQRCPAKEGRCEPQLLSNAQSTQTESIQSLLGKDLRHPTPSDFGTKRIEQQRLVTRAWAKKVLGNKDHYRPVTAFPDAPELSIFNWGSENFEDIESGISRTNLLAIVNGSGSALSQGIYATDNPAGSAYFGPFPMEIVLYKGHFPVEQDDGSVIWEPITMSQFSVDPHDTDAHGFGAVLPGNISQAYLVRDPRIIKALRWPSKKWVLAAWFGAQLTTQVNTNAKWPYIMALGSQWMVIPAYSGKARNEIIWQDPARVLWYSNEYLYDPLVSGPRYIASRKESLDPKLLTLASAQSRPMQIGGIVSGLLLCDDVLIDPITGVFNYRLAIASARKIAPDEAARAMTFASGLNPGRLRSLLRFVLSHRPEFFSVRDQAKQEIENHLQKIGTDARIYKMFTDVFLKEERLSLANSELAPPP